MKSRTEYERKVVEKLYYSISEVSDAAEVKPHVLRYWETQFKMLRPQKNRAGNRQYRRKDLNLVLTIRDLLYHQGYTIVGARRKLLDARRSGEVEDGRLVSMAQAIPSARAEEGPIGATTATPRAHALPELPRTAVPEGLAADVASHPGQLTLADGERLHAVLEVKHELESLLQLLDVGSGSKSAR